MFRRAFLVSISASALLLVSCSQEKPAPVYRVIGEAYVGPNELPIRAEMSLRSDVVATAKHDEKLEILDRHRRFLQVRTKLKVVGWVDSRQMLSQKQRQALEEMAQRYKNAPSMGRATVYDNLNVHTDPNRYSPTFHVIQEKQHLDVIGHQVLPRAPFEGNTLELEDNTPQAPIRKKRPRKEPAIPPPPAPAAPGLPEKWLEMSRPPVYTEESGPVDSKGAKKVSKTGAASNPGGLAMDDLTLVRTEEGRVGWVLSNALFLEVPDDVAQYAEGNRITSYFSLGEVKVEAGKKHHWLWTTQSQKYAPFEFDGLRVFTYNVKRNRYETAYRERGMRGFFPVLVDASKAEPEFRVVVEDESGKLWQQSYSFNGTRVSNKGKQPYVPPADVAKVSSRGAAPAGEEKSLLDRLKKLIPGRN